MANLHDFINNNALLDKAVKDITDLAHSDKIAGVRDLQMSKLNDASKIPSQMPIKILIVGEYEGMKDVHYKIKTEFNLKVFEVAEITAEIDKVLNPLTEIEATDPKKVKDKQVVEEPQQNQEELKELSKVAASIKQHWEDNSDIESISGDTLLTFSQPKSSTSLLKQSLTNSS